MAAKRKSVLKDMLIRTTRASKLSKYQNFGEAIQPCIVYWRTTNLKGEYEPNKITIKIFSFGSLGQGIAKYKIFTFSDT